MAYNKKGKLVVNITAAGGALPGADALVRIYGADDENYGAVYSLLTDIDGVSRALVLPAPSARSSESPGGVGPSYALYDVTAVLEGYYPFKISNVAVFDGITTVQAINLIPLPTRRLNTSFPRGNLVAVSSENEMLE